MTTYVSIGFFGTPRSEGFRYEDDARIVDSLSTWLLLAIWVVPHLLLILDLKAPWLVSKRLRDAVSMSSA